MSKLPVYTSALKKPESLKRPLSGAEGNNENVPVVKQCRFDVDSGSKEDVREEIRGNVPIATGSKLLQPKLGGVKKSSATVAATKAKRRSLAIANGKPGRSLVSNAGKPPLASGPRPNVARAAPPAVVRTTTVQRSSISSTISNRSSGGAVGSVRPKPNGNILRPTTTPMIRKPQDTTEERLKSLEMKTVVDLQERESLKERLLKLEETNTQLTSNVQEKERSTVEATQESENLRKRLRSMTEDLETTNSKFRREKEELTYCVSTLEKQKTQLDSELNQSRAEVAGLRSSITQFTSAQAVMEAQFAATKASLEAAEASKSAKDQLIQSLLGRVAELEKIADEANVKIRWGESERRKLHNAVQELKGNIRVFCRVRPLLNEEKLPGAEDLLCASSISFPDPDKRVIELEKPSMNDANESVMNATKGGLSSKQNKFDFSFDRVFGPDASQLDIFCEISQLVQSALDGYNCCIFAYGQTGSGKTYTMEGPNPDVLREHPETAGMIPLAVRQVFQTATELIEKGWKYTFEASFIEIYNETLRDLLSAKADSDAKLEIKLPPKGSNEVIVTNLTTEQVDSVDKVERLLDKSRKNRAVAATKCNERSSRSHAVFRLKIRGKNHITEETREGYLNLIDLAGSERLKESQATGERLKETQNINGSLSALGTVILALANKDSHVPYRNSKLTFLLQNSLGGNSKTLMFVAISPKEEHFNESLNSLRFATQVNQCQIGTAQRKAIVK